MKRAVLVGIFCLFGYLSPGEASAEKWDVLKSTMSSRQVSVSSSTATQMDADADGLPGRQFISLQNQDTEDVFCAFASADVGSSQGIKLSAGDALTIMLGFRNGVSARLTVYCQTSRTDGSSTVQVTEGR